MWAHLDNEEQKQDLHIYFMLLPLPADHCAEFCHKRKAKFAEFVYFPKQEQPYIQSKIRLTVGQSTPFFYFPFLCNRVLLVIPYKLTRIKTYVRIHLQIFAVHVTNSLDIVVSPEHRWEICRYIYNHQAWHYSLRIDLSSRTSLDG